MLITVLTQSCYGVNTGFIRRRPGIDVNPGYGSTQREKKNQPQI